MNKVTGISASHSMTFSQFKLPVKYCHKTVQVVTRQTPFTRFCLTSQFSSRIPLMQQHAKLWLAQKSWTPLTPMIKSQIFSRPIIKMKESLTLPLIETVSLSLSEKLATIDRFIKKGGDINAKDMRGESLFYKVICYRCHENQTYELIQKLSSHGLVVNQSEFAHESPFHLALASRKTAQGKTEAIRALLSIGLDINTKNSSGQTPLDQVFLMKERNKDNSLSLDRLIEEMTLCGALTAKQFDSRTEFPAFELMMTLEAKLEALERFVKREGIGAKNAKGESLVSHLLTHPYLENHGDDIYTLILKLGQLGLKSDMFTSPLHMIISSGARNEVKIAAVRAFMYLGWDVNQLYNFTTPLEFAIKSGENAVAEELKRHGALQTNAASIPSLLSKKIARLLGAKSLF